MIIMGDQHLGMSDQHHRNTQQLYERGLIKNLNKPIGTYLASNQIPDAWRDWIYKVSLLDLIKHRSGLPELLYPSEGQKSIYNHANESGNLVDHFFKKENASINHTALQENIRKANLDGELYSNIAYNILAVVIENLSELSYDEFLRQNIFIPAGMSSSFSGSDNNYSLLDLVAGSDKIAKPQVYSIE